MFVIKICLAQKKGTIGKMIWSRHHMLNENIYYPMKTLSLVFKFDSDFRQTQYLGSLTVLIHTRSRSEVDLQSRVGARETGSQQADVHKTY